MILDSKLYLHDSDKAAMATLKAIPGFEQAMKAFMKIWDEQQYRILNMSSHLRLGENQLSKYYNMLPPICEKLGIEVPELYVELNVEPNAYTFGDTKPFIVLTSGLFETIPEELIPTIIAHECGHIACHHTLYRTMGTALIKGAASLVSGLGNIALYPIQVAFAYWMRCSEFSADRAAIICDGSAKNTIDVMMCLAGFDKDIMAEANVDLFMEQAVEYREYVNNSTWNKALEFIMFQYIDHPLNAVRAYEAREWGKTERYCNIIDYINSSKENSDIKLPVELNPKKFIGKNVYDIQAELLGKGFTNVVLDRTIEATKKIKDGTVLSFSINGNNDCTEDMYKCNSDIQIKYYEAKTEEEIALEHSGEIKMTEGYKFYLGNNYEEVENQFKELGFTNIKIKEMAMSKLGWREKENCTAKIIIDNQSQFEKDSWFSPDVEIIIYYFVSV